MRGFLLILIGLLLVYFTESHGLREVRSIRTARKVGPPDEKRIVCYYSSWAIYRGGESKFSPEDIHPHLCTHILYAFATLDNDVIVPFDSKQDIEKMGFAKLAELKKANPNLKLVLSLGGTKEGSVRFSKLAADPMLRKQFAINARVYIQSLEMDGLDLVWQYPSFTEGSSSSDKENYVELVKELRDQFKDDLCLSMAVPKWKRLIDLGFDLPNLAQYLDFMNVLTYNYHEATEPTVNHVAPLYHIPEDPDPDSNIDTTIQAYMKLGVDPAKLNLGIPLYGVTFILEDPELTDIGSATDDEGMGTQERGAIIYNEVCKRLAEERWTIKHLNKSATGPYAYSGTKWMAYDDEEMVRTKARYAGEKGLGGIMYWSIDMDDFKGRCNQRAYPLIKAGRETFLITKPLNPNPSNTMAPTKAPPKTKPTTASTPIITPPQTRPPTRKISTKPPINTITLPTQRPIPRLTSTTADTPYIPPFPQDPNNNLIPTESPDTDIYPGISGTKTFHSNRDLIFQNIKVWIQNHYYGSNT